MEDDRGDAQQRQLNQSTAAIWFYPGRPLAPLLALLRPVAGGREGIKEE